MTKETKIGLLVGMGFIILIGILVSDHLSEAQKQTSPNMRGLSADMVHDPMPESLNTNTGIRSDSPQTPPHIFRTEELTRPGETLPRNNFQPDIHSGAATPNPLINPPVARNQPNLEPHKTVMAPYNRPDNTGNINSNRTTPPQNNNTNTGKYYSSTKDNNTPDIPGFTKQQNSQFAKARDFSVNPKRPKIGPTEEEKQQEAAKANVREHHVQKSETLSDISKKYYGTVKYWNLIYQYNKKIITNPNFVREGVRLVIPELKKKKTDTATKKKAPGTPRKTTPAVEEKKLPQDTQTMNYTVKEGDMLSKIAAKFYGTQSAWPKLYKLNQSVIKNPNALKPGTVIRVPRKK